MTMTQWGTLAAREQIKELRARYCRFVDGKDWAAFGALFLPHAVLDLTDDTGKQIRGRETIVDFVREALAQCASVHHGHMPEIYFTSHSRASGIWAMEDMLFWPAGSASTISRLHGYGHYHDVYVLAEQGWLFESVALRRIKVVTA